MDARHEMRMSSTASSYCLEYKPVVVVRGAELLITICEKRRPEMRFESNKIYNPRALPSLSKVVALARGAENEYGSSSGHSKLNVTGINLWGGKETGGPRTLN